MDATDVYPSQWLKASDLGQKELQVTIKGAKRTTISESEDKIELSFQESDKTLLLNKTNAMRLIEAHGKDTDGWVGKEIILYTAQVSYKGEEVPAIRVRCL